jgi:phosphate ABC transporter phosphate-binding protein
MSMAANVFKRRRLARWGALLVTLLLLGFVAVSRPSVSGAASTGYVPVSGEGSTWSQNAISQWIADVHQYGMRINYTGDGSSAGRQAFLHGTTDFAASDIPFQTHPEDGSAPENPAAGSYAYTPVTAGGTVFMYNLLINGHRVTNLRLSGANITKIFTGVIKNWSDPALKADNPQLNLPNRPVVPVVRSDGSGSTAQFSLWMINQYPQLWNDYCGRTGRGGSCGETSYYPTIPGSGMIGQAGDLGVAGYVSQSYANGAIGYVEYSYALNAGFPVAKMLNAAGYYTEPTPDNVAVSLLKAQVDTTDVNDPSRYLTQQLGGVYSDPDPRTYPLSSYSYMILPTAVQGQFNTAKGKTLGAFAYYAMCQGQQESASLGYSPMPINLVEDSFNQIRKIPGVVAENINITSCNNPTFSPNGANLLAQEDPFPPACDKQGPTQCSTGTGGAAKISTPLSGTGGSGSAGGSSGGSSAAGGSAAAGSANAAGTSPGQDAGKGSKVGSTALGNTGPAAAGSGAASCDVNTGICGNSTTGTSANGTGPEASPQSYVLASSGGWTTTQTLMAVALLFLVALIVAPGLVAQYLRRRDQ